MEMHRLSWIPLCIALFSLPAMAKNVQIKVNLFGQDCSLIGPSSQYDQKKLRVIHGISPAEIPPINTAKLANDLLKRLKNADAELGSLGKTLEPYTSKLKSRIAALQLLYSRIRTLNKKSAADFIKSAKPHTTTSIEGIVNSYVGKSADKMSKPHFIIAFKEAITPRPEEEFHRIIRKLNINYNCYYQELDGGGGEELE